MISWNIYEITSEEYTLHRVKFRGRIRLLGIENDFDVLVENAMDKDNCVRFAIVDENELTLTENRVREIVSDANVEKVMDGVVNPVLSKLKVNIHERYID